MDNSLAYVRTEDAPKLSPPANLIGLRGWVMANLFSNWKNALLTVVFGYFIYTVLSAVLGWAVFRAVWTGDNRDACAIENAGACWPFVQAKFLQWIYGFYPIDQRWRVNICYLLLAGGLIPMLIPSVPYKMWNALFLLFAFPLIALILLTGGHFSLTALAFIGVGALLAAIAAFLPLAAYGMEDGIHKAKPGITLVGFGVLVWFVSFFVDFNGLASKIAALLISADGVLAWVRSFSVDFNGLASKIAALLIFAGGTLGLNQLLGSTNPSAKYNVKLWAIVGAGLLLAMLIMKIDFGLEYVETSQWGGLLVTLVVAITGIVASLPLGILLALGRQSQMPIVKYFCVTFIELWRGVPLITVLFMASVMLPLFLPPGTNFDKLTRALIATAIFSSAYMAEVIRGGLQAIPRGQYEAAQALGLPYWNMMNLIVLPQALKIVIPGIVNSFISLFKDTTLVTVIGLYDLLNIISTGSADATWASPQTGNTGYFSAALLFWIFCFSMSRYSQFVERRLNTGHKR
jgi:general L-amino acid transport system permease protein